MDISACWGSHICTKGLQLDSDFIQIKLGLFSLANPVMLLSSNLNLRHVHLQIQISRKNVLMPVTVLVVNLTYCIESKVNIFISAFISSFVIFTSVFGHVYFFVLWQKQQQILAIYMRVLLLLIHLLLPFYSVSSLLLQTQRLQLLLKLLYLPK